MAALIVDISDEADPFGVLEELAMHVEPGVRVFVIGDNETVDFYRRLTRDLGVQEYICKPLNRELIARMFLPALTGRSATYSQNRVGRVITVMGVRGGVGATTIAVNLATHLADRSRQHTLLFDADLHCGSAALMLQGATGGGLRMALEHPSRVDGLFAERSAPAINDRLNVLATEEALGSLVNPPEGAARHLMTVMCKRFNQVVVDLPRFASSLNYELRDTAHVQVLVMDPSLASLRDVLRHLSLPQSPSQASRPLVVLNRIGIPGSLTVQQVIAGLGDRVDIRIPWLPKKLPISATLGSPAVRSRGPFQSAIVKLADEIMPRRGHPVEVKPRRWWQK